MRVEVETQEAEVSNTMDARFVFVNVRKGVHSAAAIETGDVVSIECMGPNGFIEVNLEPLGPDVLDTVPYELVIELQVSFDLRPRLSNRCVSLCARYTAEPYEHYSEL